jgi:uncharacterized protein YllA (UPF0747 family)
MVSELDYSTYATSFAGMMRALFSDWGLRLADPIPLRQQTGSVLASLVERWPELEDALATGSQALRDAGIDPPLSEVRVFEIVSGKRVAAERRHNRLRFSSGEYSFRDAARLIAEEPERFSPGAALRPLCQDAVLPVAATLGGATELAYLTQILPLYGVGGITPSPRCPRVSATFLEPAVVRSAKKAGLHHEALFRVQDLLARPVAGGADPRVDAVEEAGEVLLRALDQLDLSPPPRWLRTSRADIESAVSRVTRRLHQERLEATGATRTRLERIAAAVLPGGKLQERVANVVEFLNLHGPEFVRRCVETLDPLAEGHQVAAIGMMEKANGD